MRRRHLAILVGLLLLGIAGVGFVPIATSLGQVNVVGGGRSDQTGVFLIDCGDGVRVKVGARTPEGCLEVAIVQFRLTNTRYGAPRTWKTEWKLEVLNISNPEFSEDQVLGILMRDLPRQRDQNFADYRVLLESDRAELVIVDRSAAFKNGLSRLARWASVLIVLLVLLLLAYVVIGGLVRGRQLRRIERGECSRCGYDLKRIGSPVCPECGWERRRDSPYFRDG